MGAKLRNIMEDVAMDLLTKSLAYRYDICTCQACRNEMLAHVLSCIPAKYVTTDEEAMAVIIEQTRVEHQAELVRAVLEAISTVSQNPNHELKDDKNRIFQMLIDKIVLDRGVDFRHYHQELLKRRVGIRIRQNGLTSYSDYLQLLIKKPEEYDKLLEVLCINVSEFFRDPPVWERIKQMLELIIREKIRSNDKTLRIWSAGCANAEEPFSIAILIKEILGFDNPCSHVEIHGTDVDKKCLSFVNDPEYPKESLKNIDKTLMARYFNAEGGMYRPKDEIRDIVQFRSLNLTSDDTVKQTDMVVCRNVFIYYDRDLQEQLLMKFYNSLKPRGYLVMGKVETIITEAKQIFEEVDAENRIYKKKKQGP
jgi:chemotaxis protein methyltransferase CheR